MINFFFEDIEEINLPSNVDIWLKNTISNESKKMGKINYIFCSDDYLLEINKQYLEHNYYTDIITFDYVKNSIISGDIFVSLPRILENSSLYSISFNDELKRVLIHGVLHLCGYKDKTDEQKINMRQKEDYYLNLY